MPGLQARYNPYTIDPGDILPDTHPLYHYCRVSVKMMDFQGTMKTTSFTVENKDGVSMDDVQDYADRMGKTSNAAILEWELVQKRRFLPEAVEVQDDIYGGLGVAARFLFQDKHDPGNTVTTDVLAPDISWIVDGRIDFSNDGVGDYVATVLDIIGSDYKLVRAWVSGDGPRRKFVTNNAALINISEPTSVDQPSGDPAPAPGI